MKHLFHLITTLFLFSMISLAACGGGGGAERISEESNAGSAEQAEQANTQGNPDEGQQMFVQTCSACHGAEGQGVEGLGKDMTTSEFIADKSDAELVEFIKQGRDPSHPLNTTGVAMPPKGGNPALDDEDLYDIVAYIREIHQ
jgi:disulfide bond formation protein DsbB